MTAARIHDSLRFFRVLRLPPHRTGDPPFQSGTHPSAPSQAARRPRQSAGRLLRSRSCSPFTARQLATVVVVHSFCNWMGFPDFARMAAHPRRGLLLACLFGVRTRTHCCAFRHLHAKDCRATKEVVTWGRLDARYAAFRGHRDTFSS